MNIKKFQTYASIIICFFLTIRWKGICLHLLLPLISQKHYQPLSLSLSRWQFSLKNWIFLSHWKNHMFFPRAERDFLFHSWRHRLPIGAHFLHPTAILIYIFSQPSWIAVRYFPSHIPTFDFTQFCSVSHFERIGKTTRQMQESENLLKCGNKIKEKFPSVWKEIERKIIKKYI